MQTTTSRRLSVLMLLPQYPWPLPQGLNLRMYNLAAAISGGCDLDLVTLEDEPPPPAVTELFRRVETYSRAAPSEDPGPFARLRSSVSVDSLYPVDPAVAEHLRKIIAERDYDLIWALACMLPQLPSGPDTTVPVISDVVDDGVLEWWRILWRFSSLRGLVHKFNYLLRNLRFERRYLGRKRVKAALFTSEVDARVFRRIRPGTRAIVIPNGVDVDFYQPMESPLEANTIVFEGNMNFPPNVEGVIHFCREILPRIAAEIPEVRFLIVGKDPAPEVSALASSRVVVTGFVDDVRPFVARAAVFVSPLQSGCGIKNKVLQAWSMGKACVVTSLCTGGLMARDGWNLLVRDSDEKLAKAVVGLLRDPNDAARLGDNGRRTVLDHYTWQHQGRKLEELMRQVAEDAASCRT